MHKVNTPSFSGKVLFIGLDLHKEKWSVTVRCEGIELKSCTLPADKKKLVDFLHRYYPGGTYKLTYEAGCFGYWLYDYLVERGITVVVTPPNLILRDSARRVKTNRIDSRKLALLLEKGLLKQVAVPSPLIRQHRNVVRIRRQLLKALKALQSQIRAILLFYGLEIDYPKGRWPNYFLDNLRRLRFESPEMTGSFQILLSQYETTRQNLVTQTRLVRELAHSIEHKAKVELMGSVPGAGTLTAIELLTELYDIARFPNGDKIASYVGLTPSEDSTAEYEHKGHITGAGNAAVRGLLIELAWRAIRYDGFLFERFHRIAKRRGRKIAIVAIARTLIVRIRRMLITGEPYVTGIC
jgi:transposase